MNPNQRAMVITGENEDQFRRVFNDFLTDQYNEGFVVVSTSITGHYSLTAGEYGDSVYAAIVVFERAR
jgi:hypothetical protein